MKSSPRILYEDPHLIVLSKPAGLLSQGEHTGDENLVDWARHHVGRNYVGLVHRLDRNTSGLMVLAKRSKSAERLTTQLQKGVLVRQYEAWLVGKLPLPRARWEHWLLKDEASNTSKVVPPSTNGAKQSVLFAETVSYGQLGVQPLTLARFTLETGRSHQIRAQAAAQGFPLLGDLKYGRQKLDFPRPALHSCRLEFEHPMTQEKLIYEDPLPEDMRAIKPLR